MENKNEFAGKTIPSACWVRKKWRGTGTNPWLVVSDTGEWSVEELGRDQIMSRTGIPSRDFRAFELELPSSSSSPSAGILRRGDRAIVFNLDDIKVIITHKEILIPDYENYWLQWFIFNLTTKLSHHSSDDFVAAAQSEDVAENAVKQSEEVAEKSLYDGVPEAIDGCAKTSSGFRDLKPLPFEFRALEICLQSIFENLDYEISAFEKEKYPNPRRLSPETISISHLEDLICARYELAAMSWRVQKVREELENLFKNDMLMAEMCLTDELATRQSESLVVEDEFELVFYSENKVNTESSPAIISTPKQNIEQLEMIFGACFIRAEEMSSKLSSMYEDAEWDELYIRDVLDEERSQPVRKGV